MGKDKVEKSTSKGGKAKKKKWSKAKVKEKLNNMVLFDKSTYDKLLKEVPTMKLITPSVLSERFRINGSLARSAIRELLAKGYIKSVVTHGAQCIYTRTGLGAAPEAPAGSEKGKQAAKGKAAPKQAKPKATEEKKEETQ